MSADQTATSQEVACIGKPTSVADLDEAGYLNANPDIKAKGIGALAHFEAHGRAEGRLQTINSQQIQTLRETKIKQLLFSRPPSVDRHFGQPVNFLSQELIQEFTIPDAPPISAHPYPTHVVKLIRDNPNKLFLDVGAGLRPTYYHNVVNTEIYPSASTDVLCVGEGMPFTLEHTRRPWDVAAEICRVLKPGGTVMIDYPFMQPVHGYPHHYFNATPMGNRSLFEDTCDIVSLEIGWHHHPMVGLQWVLTVFRQGLPPTEAGVFGNLRVADIIDRPIDALLDESYCRDLHPDMQRVIASGSMVIGVKRPLDDDEQPPPVAAGARIQPPQPRTGADGRVRLLMQENDALRYQLAVIQQSRSWRMTAPMRGLGRLIKGQLH
jgi:hypothetical protein